MPLMLDNPMGGAAMQVDLDDVDDLFGDAVPLGLPSRPPSKRLLLRLDELRSRGSCQSLAWSKSGTIASIAPDGMSLELRYLRAHPRDGTWGLSDARTWSPREGLLGGPIVHLSWAPTSISELAIVDAVGRVAILNFMTNLNSPSLVRRWDSDPVDDLHAVVGSYWLNTTPMVKGLYNPLQSAAVKSGNRYTYESTSTMGNGPYHPNPNRSAFLCVTTNGVLKMFWNQNNNKVEETTLELESITTSDDSVTHAAICSDGRMKCLLVVLATATKQLQVLQVGLNWGQPAAPDANTKPVTAASQQMNPVFKERHVAISTWLAPGSNEPNFDSSMSELSLLELIPPAIDGANKAWVPAVILTVRSFVPTADAPYQDVQSVIDRWEIPYDQPQTLHPAFEELGSRRNNAGSNPPAGPRLRRLSPIVVNKIVIGFNIIRLGTVIAFTYSDGSVEYRDRITMNEVWNMVNLNRISSVIEAGFTQPGEPSCLQTVLSPNLFSVVQLGDDGKVKWHGVNYTLAETNPLAEENFSAIVSLMTISAAQAVMATTNIDDILASARQFLSNEDFSSKWVTELVSLLRITVDYTEESPHDSLVRNNPLQLCLSTLNHLGWKGEYQPRTFRGKLSMLALNLRNIVIVMTIASNGPQGVMKDRSPLDEPEVVNALAGCCKWSMDLICWLADSLFCLLDDRKFLDFLNQQQFSEMRGYLLSKNEVALHMVLSSVTRGLLSAVCRRLWHLNGISQKAVSYYENLAANTSNDPNAPPGIRPRMPPLQEAYQKILRCTSTSLIKVQEFEKLLITLGADIRKQYNESFAGLAKSAAAAPQQQNQNPNAQRANAGEEAVKRAKAHCELELLLASGGPPAATFLKVVDKFFKEDLAEFRAHTDPAGLFYGNYDILEVDDGAKALSMRRQRGAKVDLFKRFEISRKGAKANNGEDEIAWRRCARCGSVMEDIAVVPSKPGINFVLSQQKNCCCAGRLALLSPGKLVG